MGCVADKPIPPNLGTQPNQEAPLTMRSNYLPPTLLPLCDKVSTINAKLIEAIKKRDVILFQRVIQQHQIKPCELIGPSSQAKTVLHKLAEYNFSEGMALLLNEISQKSAQPSKVLNLKDIDGNTPLLLCCLSNAVDTLEVLVRNEFVDFEALNFAKKTALEIAMEMESPCVHVLSTVLNNSEAATKATLKSCSNEGSEQINSMPEDQKNAHSDIIGPDTRTSLDGKGQISSLKDTKDFEEPSKFRMDSRLQEMIAEIKVEGENFIDIEFPHEFYFLEKEEMEGSLLIKYPQLAFKRPEEFMNIRVKSPVLFDDFYPNMTSNSPLAGCEIYSAFAVMSEYPQRLSKIFNNTEVSKHGIYSVNFTVAGIPIEIILDDYFPAKDPFQLLYSQSLNNELWFSLLEKAFAKLHGGYTDLENVRILEAMETLTGMPVAQKSLKDVAEDKLWAKLIEYDKRNYIMSAGSFKRSELNKRNRIFCVVSVTEINGYKLIKLRNHFGDFYWKGDFSLNSNLWTDDIKEHIGYHDGDNTCFYMQLKEFIKEFDFLTICHYHENWSRSILNQQSEPNHPKFFELNVEKETEAYISVHQKLSKFVEEDPSYDISPVEIIMAKNLDGNNLQSIASGERDAFLGMPTVYIHESHRIKLEPGRYTIYVKVKWINNNINDFTLNVLSSVPTKLTQIETQNGSDFLEKLYLGVGKMSKDYFNLSNDCQFSSGWSGSHLWMYACNNSDKEWHLEVTFEKMMNLKLGKKYRNLTHIIKFEIPPRQKAVAYAKRINSGAVKVAWKFNQRWL